MTQHAGNYWSGHHKDPDCGYLSAQAVTPSDSVDLLFLGRGLYVGGAGTVVAVMEDDTVQTFVAPIVGQVLPIRIRRVNLTGTTATNLIALS